MSETLLTISNPLEGERRPGSVGLPLPGVELELDGGELWVRGPSVFAGYFERPEATAEAFTEGWFHTGDLAAIAPDGYVTILGRAKDLIISGGFKRVPRRGGRRSRAPPGHPRGQRGRVAVGGVGRSGDRLDRH